MKQLVVLKFGGAAVATPEAFGRIATLIARRRATGLSLVVVVSAMGSATDDLFELARRVHPEPPQRELDMLVSVGERVSISLLAMALQRCGVPAVSYTGSQAGIVTTDRHTSARIVSVRPLRIPPDLAAGEVVIVAGFQGVSESKEITTLGRGGSDTTAVALAAALGASHVEFYKDVDGIYDQDPKLSAAARRLESMTYAEALSVTSSSDHPVLAPRCVELAQRNGIVLKVYSFQTAQDAGSPGTSIGDSDGLRQQPPIYEEEAHALKI